MTPFEAAFRYLIGDEGSKFVDDPDDRGGPTKYGVTKKDLSLFLGYDASSDAVASMSESTAQSFYRAKFWTPLFFDQVYNVPVTTAVFDTCVLYGGATGLILAQKALNEFGQKLDVDGMNGPKTQLSLTAAQPSQFIPAFKDQILARIEAIINEVPQDKKFRGGWTNRANRLLTLVPQSIPGGKQT